MKSHYNKNHRVELRIPTISTSRLLIRPLAIEDITQEYLEWLNNPEVTKFLEIRRASQTFNIVKDYLISKNTDYKQGIHFGIFDNDGQRHVGTVTFNLQNEFHKTADISFVIGHPDAQDKGYATEAVHGALYFSFFEAGLRKITAGHYQDNLGSRNVLLKNGFTKEGIKRKQYVDIHGNETDSIIYGLHRDNFTPSPLLLGTIPPKIIYAH